MSDNNQVSQNPEAIQAIVPTWSFVSLAQGGQDPEPPLDVDLQVVDPAIIRIGNIEVSSSHFESTADLQVSGNIQATVAVPLHLPVPASVPQSSIAVGLQVSASFGGLRPYPNTPSLWAAYFRDLAEDLPRVNYLLGGFKTPFHPSASMSDYLVRVMSGDTRGGPVVGAGMHSMALYGLRQLSDLGILDRTIHLDLAMRFYRSGWVAMRKRREREFAAIEMKARDLEAEKESYQRLKDMYEGESEILERDRSCFNYNMELFQATKAKFDHDVKRLGHVLGLGMTIEQMQLDHDLALRRLRAVLESIVIENTAQLQMLTNMGISGGTQLWFARIEELLGSNLEHTVSIQVKVPSGGETIGQSPLAGQLKSVTQRLAATEVQIIEMRNLEAENEKLRKQVEDLTNELQESRTRDVNKGCHWVNNVCSMM